MSDTLKLWRWREKGDTRPWKYTDVAPDDADRRWNETHEIEALIVQRPMTNGLSEGGLSERQHALTAAAQAFCNRGFNIACPWEGDLDDLERSQFDAMVAAIDAYSELSRRSLPGSDADEAEDWVLVPREPTPEMKEAALAAAVKVNPHRSDDHVKSVALDGLSIYRAMLSAAPKPPSSPVDEAGEWVSVPKAALDWLNGEGPDPAGYPFGEFPDDQPKPRGAFWWRSLFRDICAYYARTRPPASPEAQGMVTDAYRPQVVHFEGEGDPHYEFVNADAMTITGQVFAANVEALFNVDGEVIGFRIYSPALTGHKP